MTAPASGRAGQVIRERPDGGHVGIIRINRPEAGNALSLAMIDAFLDHLSAHEADDDVKVIVIAGQGESLCAGFDVQDAVGLYGQTSGQGRHRVPSLRTRLEVHDRYFWGSRGIYHRVLRASKITVLAARGVCDGPGLYLSLCCDIVVAGAGAQFSNARWRQIGADGDVSMLINAVGLKRAREMIFCGAAWNADQAERYGLVDLVVPDEAVEDEAMRLAVSASGIIRDGIAAEKFVVHVAQEKMGVGAGFAIATMMGAMASNVHFREGEFNFLKELRDHGLDGARERAGKHFGTLPARADALVPEDGR